MKKENKKLGYICLALLALLDAYAWGAIMFHHRAADAEYYFLNVGQGDSELVVFPNNVKLLIDGGPASGLSRELGKVLSPTDRYIDLVLMTHPQLDHFEGFIDVLKNYTVGAFISTGRKGATAAYDELMRVIRERHTPYIALREGDRITTEGATIDVLSPSTQDLVSEELNDTCLVTMVSSGGHRAIFTCDAGANIEAELTQKYNLSSDILKVGHHGSRFSSSPEFLAAVHPKIAVIEVGKNSYGHPTKEALNGLAAVGAETLRTDQLGTIKAVFDAGALRVFALK